VSKKSVHVSVKPRGRNDTPQRMIKRFLKKVKKLKILETYRESLRYEKPSEKKRKQEKKRTQVLKKLAEENKIKDN
jgi:ribosomal protein S21